MTALFQAYYAKVKKNHLFHVLDQNGKPPTLKVSFYAPFGPTTQGDNNHTVLKCEIEDEDIFLALESAAFDAVQNVIRAKIGKKSSLRYENARFKPLLYLHQQYTTNDRVRTQTTTLSTPSSLGDWFGWKLRGLANIRMLYAWANDTDLGSIWVISELKVTQVS